ncbi:hypothetical protein D6783_06150 [Candidatus Woesearchaeota archaeon]|nr:MAG: hypothetical protein D6783_06150 [Candidatus Woesearchaeota archaeon]
MPHQCVKCGTLFPDGSKEILQGCSHCSGKFFFFIRKERFEELKNRQSQLTKKEKEQIEKDVYDLIGDTIDKEKPIVLDIESVNVLKPGVFELDLVNLFKKKQPLIYRLEDGKYMIDLVETFQKMRNN